MTYQDFIEHNKKMQNRFEKKPVQLFSIRIEEVRLSENYVRLSNNKVSQIGYLVNAIMQERGCISNPSALKGWSGFSQQKQQSVELTQENIEYIRNLTNQKWRDCQRKEYSIYACQIPEGYVFANLLEQPLSYKAIMKSNNGKPIMSIDKAKKVKGLGEYLKKNGCYITKADRVVLCGTRGELWDVNPEKYQSAYTMTDGNPIREIPKKWTQVKRAAENSARAVGIQLPIQFLGKYKTSWAVLTVNDLNSEGHGKGDILVAPKLANGQPDYSNISPTNNEVFALIYNQGVGGWNRTGNITSPENIEGLTLEEVNKVLSFTKTENIIGNN